MFHCGWRQGVITGCPRPLARPEGRRPLSRTGAWSQSWSLLAYTSALSRGSPRFTDAYEGSEVPRDLGTASWVIWESCVVSPSEPPISLTKRMKRARVRGAEQAQAPLAGRGPFSLDIAFIGAVVGIHSIDQSFQSTYYVPSPGMRKVTPFGTTSTIYRFYFELNSWRPLPPVPKELRLCRETDHSNDQTEWTNPGGSHQRASWRRRS